MSNPPQFAIDLRGYDRAAVDQLVARIAHTLANPSAPGAVTPAEIETSMFKVVMGGYNEKEVDDYLDLAIKQLHGSENPAPEAEPAPAPDVLPSLSVKPRGHRFGTGFGGVYRIADVDAYVERVEATVNTTLTSLEVQSVRLRGGFRGYRADEVDTWINQVQAFLIARGR